MENELFMLQMSFGQALKLVDDNILELTTNKYKLIIQVPIDFPQQRLTINSIPDIQDINQDYQFDSILSTIFDILNKYDLHFEKSFQKKLQIFDTHAHFLPIHLNKFGLLMDKELNNFNSKVTILATNPTEWDIALNLCNENNQLYFTIGLHPFYVLKNLNTIEQDLQEMNLFIDTHQKNCRFIAIGESGISVEPQDLIQFKAQKHSLIKHCELSKKYTKPLITHCHQETQQEQVLHIVKQFKIKGISHGFGGTIQQAEQLQQMGWKGSMNSLSSLKKFVKIIQKVGLDFVLLETDSPYGSVPGGPCQVFDVANKLSNAIDMNITDLALKCNQNACEIYRYK